MKHFTSIDTKHRCNAGNALSHLQAPICIDLPNFEGHWKQRRHDLTDEGNAVAPFRNPGAFLPGSILERNRPRSIDKPNKNNEQEGQLKVD